MTIETHKSVEKPIEWPTVALFFLTYCGWFALTGFHTQLPIVIVIVMLVLLVTLHSSLQHEVIHGHPTRSATVNYMMAFPALGLAVAYPRYELLHLQHHRNWLLTDPYDDSESYFVAYKKWLGLNMVVQLLLKFNNTLFGRLTVGPAIMVMRMLRSELSLSIINKDIRRDWLIHSLSSVFVIVWLLWVEFSIFLYVALVAYPAISLLMLRAYSEHLPEENIEQRSAIIKSNRLMQLLYLNNNLHRVHHDYPEVAWYKLPELYRREYQQHTIHVYKGYTELFKRYGFKQRFRVEHPFLARD